MKKMRLAAVFAAVAGVFRRFGRFAAQKMRSPRIGCRAAKKLRTKLVVYRCVVVFLLGMLGLFAYASYDYWVFRLLISGNYVFTDALDALQAQHIHPQNRQSFFRDFDRIMISVMTAQLREINQDRYTYLYSPQAFVATRERERTVAATTRIAALDENTVILHLPNFARASRRFVTDHREYLAGYPFLILDLRGNLGGWLNDARLIANLFLPAGVTISYEHTRLPIFTRTIRARGDAFFDFRHVVILQDARTASASEGLILALAHHLPNVTTMGQITFGKGIGQVTIPLTGGYAVRATVLDIRGPDGASIHMQGIAPDIFVDADADIIHAALQLLGP